MMDTYWKRALGSVILLVLMVALSASEMIRLQCQVTFLDKGQLHFQLIADPGSDSPGLPQDCAHRSWEDVNRTVLTRNSEVNENLVQGLTDWTLDLKECRDFAHFTAECSDFGRRLEVDAVCSTNCSFMPGPSPSDPPRADPSLKVCFSEEWQCVDHGAVVGGCLLVLLVVLVVAVGLMTWKFLPRLRRWRRRRSRMPSPGDEELQQFRPGDKSVPAQVIVA